MSELLDKIDDKLAEVCAGGYALGLVGEANIVTVLQEFPGLVTRQRVYRLGDVACLVKGVEEDTPGLAELLELLESAGDYPILDEDVFQEVINEEIYKWILEFAETHNLSGVNVELAAQELGFDFDWEQDYVYLNGDEEELRVKAEELGQTWDAHYFSGETHTPEFCTYCKEAEAV